ncbi:porin family protein [Polaribacter ponticola]|uniref:Porin family protein n=1 Tax=Polaribacter ponticola TaxID=2978475 RepID=A0ABT5SAD2_9FLAO|nr:porin family protein [Polaribacter sp. MSW5]MDD7915069.1 porin family protein [Polaribacter sp. MSW5]
MYKIIYFFVFVCITSSLYAQKDSLQLGDKYADDQIYASITYAQFSKQPTTITRSSFSYAISAGFLKDFILSKSGNISFALGVGYGFDFFNHELKVSETNNITVFDNAKNISSNVFKAHNLEFPIEFRWRTSTAKKYDFWRIYTGVKFLYNLTNKFQYTENAIDFENKNISAYRKLQYGLTFSAGYTEFNAYLFYGLTPIFKNGTLNGEDINSSILKFGLIFYIL